MANVTIGGNTTGTTIGAVSGTTTGIAVSANATATVTIVNNVTGTSGSGISTSGGTGLTTVLIDRGITKGGTNAIGATSSGQIQITNNATIENLSGLASGQVLSTNSSGNVSVANNANMTGTVSMAGTGPQSITNSGTWNTLGTSTFTTGISLVDNTGMIAFSDSATFSNLANLTNSGTLKFTSASGVLTTAGNVTFSPTSLFSLQVTPGAASKIVAGGSATLAGAVSATFAPGSYSLGSSYVILSASSHTGTFSSLDTPGLNRTLRASLDYGSADNVSIDITSALISTAGLNRNQANVANALNSYFSGSGYLPPGFLTVFQQTGAALANSLTQLSGETATGAQKAALDIANGFINTMMNPYVGNRGAGGSFGPMSYAPAPSARLRFGSR